MVCDAIVAITAPPPCCGGPVEQAVRLMFKGQEADQGLLIRAIVQLLGYGGYYQLWSLGEFQDPVEEYVSESRGGYSRKYSFWLTWSTRFLVF